MKQEKNIFRELLELYIPTESFIKNDAKDIRQYVEEVKIFEVNIQRLLFAAPINLILLIVNLLTAFQNITAFTDCSVVSFLATVFNTYVLYKVLKEKRENYKNLLRNRKKYRILYYCFWWGNGILLNVLAFIRYDFIGDVWLFIVTCVIVSLGPICTYKESWHPVLGSIVVYILISIDFLYKNSNIQTSTVFVTFWVAILVNGLCFVYQRLTVLNWTMLSYIRLKVFLDPLTKLMTRKGANVVLQDAKQIDYVNGTDVGVIMLDIDYFKKFNDMRGHDYGDECLENVAAIIKQNCIGNKALPIRHGGEEIVILLFDSSLKNTYDFAEKIRIEIEENGIETPYKEISNNVTVSIGISTECIKELNSYEDIIAKADEMLYKAKENGRNRVYPQI